MQLRRHNAVCNPETGYYAAIYITTIYEYVEARTETPRRDRQYEGAELRLKKPPRTRGI